MAEERIIKFEDILVAIIQYKITETRVGRKTNRDWELWYNIMQSNIWVTVPKKRNKKNIYIGKPIAKTNKILIKTLIYRSNKFSKSHQKSEQRELVLGIL